MGARISIPDIGESNVAVIINGSTLIDSASFQSQLFLRQVGAILPQFLEVGFNVAALHIRQL
jgi:hypothetical protein